MSDKPTEDRSVPAVQTPPERREAYPHDALSQETLSQMLEIEKARIDSTNRRTEVAKQAIDASNESDKRQFDYQMAKLKSEDDAGQRRDNLAKWVVGCVGIFVGAITLLFLWMAFFGDPGQRSMAMQILTTLAIGGGGYGIVTGLIQLIRRLMRR